jgi:hypothetical protein
MASASGSEKRTDPELPEQQFPHILQEKDRPFENHSFGCSAFMSEFIFEVVQYL